jgi:CubicO group peptidase (beta-lactamase class C family)
MSVLKKAGAARAFAVHLLLILWAGTGHASELTSQQRAQLAAAIAVYQDRAGAPAISVYVDQGGVSIYRADVGLADVDARWAVGPDSVYGIGSITKSFTAHAILTLVAAGRLMLDDTVGSILPDYRGPGARVTISQLLTHTSGIPNYVNEIPGLQPRLRRSEMQRADVLATFEPLPLLFEPGSRWSYSNSGYYVLGLIIEHVTGKSYYDYLRDDILKPLGITRVWSGDDREIVPKRAHGYDWGAHGLENATPWFYLVPFSAGSLLTTAAELAHYRHAVFTAPSVPARVRELITTEVPLSDGESTGYTLGALEKSQFGGLLKYAHSGEIWGYAGSHAYYPTRDTTIVVLTNRKAAMTPVSLERSIARILFGIPAPAMEEGKLSAKDASRYSGVYTLGIKRIGPPTLSFANKDGQLYFAFGTVTDTGRMAALDRSGPDKFVLADDPETSFQFSSRTPRALADQVVLEALNGQFAATRTH